MLQEPLKQMFSRSTLLVLDFAKIARSTPPELDIRHYFATCERRGENPRRPEKRQQFNNAAIAKLNTRYLVSQYAEDRVAMLTGTPAGDEGRTIHMGVDIFATDQEQVSSPCDGEIVRSSYEPGFGEYGNYLILRPTAVNYYIFLGHLANDRVGEGLVSAGQLLGHLGDHIDNENGGWSRHLHLQILTELPANGKTPIGYSTSEDLSKNAALFPNPMGYFSDWHVD